MKSSKRCVNMSKPSASKPCLKRTNTRPSNVEIAAGFIVTNGAAVLGCLLLPFGGIKTLIGIACLGFFVFGWARAFNSDLPWRKL